MNISRIASIYLKKSAQGLKLTNLQRNKISQDFKNHGLDGNGRFSKAQSGFAKALEVLQHNGIVLDDFADSHKFLGYQGRLTLNLGVPGSGSFDPPIPLVNTMLVLSFHKRAENNFEVLAYLA